MLDWLENILKNDLEQYKLIAVFFTMTLESACIPIPSEIVMPYAGHLVAKGSLNLWTTTMVAALANLIGSWTAYGVGRFGGRKFIDRYGKYIFLSHKHLALSERWFDHRGEITVFLSRMLPAVRTFISLPAGIARMDLIKFSIYTFLGSLLWNFALVYLGYIFTDKWEELQVYLHDFNFIALGGLGMLGAVYFIFTALRGRR